LLINSLQDYKKYYPVNNSIGNNDYLRKIHPNELNTVVSGLNEAKNEYLAISNDIHSILSNCPDLNNNQKLNFCCNQRYYMKLYLKEVLRALKNFKI